MVSSNQPVVVFGGHGVFGSLIAQELGAEPLSRRDGVDVRDPDGCRAALEGRTVAVHCAGPYSDDTLLRACLETGCHYVDIADDRAYTAKVQALGDRFKACGLTAAWGCSSLPSISGALATGLIAPHVTLFIGNRNPKGAAAIASLVRQFGTDRAMRDGVVVDVPGFGRRRVYTFPSPGHPARVGFESRLGTRLLATMAALGLRWDGFLTALSRWFCWYGSSGGVVLAEDPSRRAWVRATENGQRMAALPAVYAVRAILEKTARPGAWTANELLGADNLLSMLQRDGYVVERG